ncbi:PspA/IM30 family protein [Streptomyces sp. NBC_01190]|uniref:PspA/IM30 family protein n=1 Tax=Streptomyces sp. NBC_01190 TaxID=2903767 RepID=UPI003864E2B9|nr:PspA/IM30 family protein [Streptomyces sp. NBC_01190]
MSKQTVLGRVGQLARANVGEVLDEAEDPQKLIDQLIRTYGATIAEAQEALTAAIADHRLMQQDHAEDVGAAAEWGARARTASGRADELRTAGSGAAADRFDRLARVALGRQLQSEKEAATVAPTLTGQREAVDKLKSGLDRMRHKLEQLKTRRDELVAHSRSAKARAPMMDAVREVDLCDPTTDLGRFEDKMRREEARVAGREEPAASSLDAQFEAPDPFSDTGEIEARLARLKSRAG